MGKKPTVYLAGAMEFAGEYARIWRKEITPHLENLGYNVWNPCEEECAVGITVDELIALKAKDFDEFRNYSRKIVDYDTTELLKCDLVVCLIDRAALDGAGTLGELTLARVHKIPVIAWIDLPRGLWDVPAWVVGCIDLYSLSKEDFYESVPDAAGKV